MTHRSDTSLSTFDELNSMTIHVVWGAANHDRRLMLLGGNCRTEYTLYL